VLFLIAQTNSNVNSVVPWVIGLVVAVLVLFGAAVLARKWMLRSDTNPAADETLMESLRRARDEGKISQDEFDRTRKQIIAKTKERMKTTDASTAALDAARKRSERGRGL
jgi:hypothetical protein